MKLINGLLILLIGIYWFALIPAAIYKDHCSRHMLCDSTRVNKYLEVMVPDINNAIDKYYDWENRHYNISFLAFPLVASFSFFLLTFPFLGWVCFPVGVLLCKGAVEWRRLMLVRR